MSYALFDNLKRTPHANTINLTQQFSNEKQIFPSNEYAVLWYGKVTPHNHNLLVAVHLVNVSSLNEFYISVNVPLECISQMPIGSIWKDGKSSEKFSFNSDSCSLRQAEYLESITNNISYIYINDADQTNVAICDLLRQAYPITLFDGKSTFLDHNTLLVVDSEKENKKVIIHPLMFFNAHYGASKEVNRILLSYLWDGGNNLDTVETLLGLNHRVDNIENIVFIPDSLVIGDAVFLHYVKYNQYTKNVVKNLNARVRGNLTAKQYSYLKVIPYHTQPITIGFNYIALNEDTLLCTEVTGISMPQGEPIHYQLAKSSNAVENLVENEDKNNFFTIQPIFQSLSLDELFLVNDQVNNRTENIVKLPIKTIGEIRELIKVDNPNNLNKAVTSGENIQIVESEPDKYGTGARSGSDGNTGLLRVLLAACDDYKKDIYGVRNIDTQYEKLLKYAQYLKVEHPNICIDCYSFKDGQLGEQIQPLRLSNNRQSFPHSVYILRVQINDNLYYFLDCEPSATQSASGTVVKIDIDHEVDFLNRNSRNPFNLNQIVTYLSHNYGRIPKSAFNKFNENGIIIARYKHMNEESSNWVISSIEKLE